LTFSLTMLMTIPSEIRVFLPAQTRAELCGGSTCGYHVDRST
jgi:hypothetical protein